MKLLIIGAAQALPVVIVLAVRWRHRGPISDEAAERYKLRRDWG